MSKSDNRCFEIAVLSCLYPAERNPNKVFHYTKHMNSLKFDGIPFPIAVKDIPKFEKQNPTISINVISPDPENRGFSIDYMNPARHRQHHINLLLLHDANTNTKHYTWIKHFSRLVADRTKHKEASYVCNSCLNCSAHNQSWTHTYPTVSITILKWSSTRTQQNLMNVN